MNLQQHAPCRAGAWCLALLLLPLATAAAGQKHHPANVPPTLEIEVLDPNADPLGRPAVELRRDCEGGLQVDIPPVVLVHRYYYTGDRTFQAQLLPGGPSIIVVNHPKSGERCYIETSLLPGAPRVTYTGHSITYDYGQHAIKIVFGLFGHPKVVYRNGTTLYRKVGDLVHAEEIHDHMKQFHEHLQVTVDQSSTVACGAVATVGDGVKQVMLPAANLLRMMPFGAVLFDPATCDQFTIRAAEYKRDHAMKRAEQKSRYDNLSLPTVR